MQTTSPPESPEPRRRREKRSRLGLILCLLAGLVVLPSICLEIYVRLDSNKMDLMQYTGRETGANPMDNWAFVDAFAAYRGKPGSAGIGKSINKHGFISTPELRVTKPKNTTRVVFLGGSSTAGTGYDLKDVETWPWYAIEELRAGMPKGQKLDFINAALGGYSTFESYGRLWSRLRAYDPDIVVMYHGWNDMYYFHRAKPEKLVGWRTLPNGEWTLKRNNGSLKMLDPWWLDHVLQYSQLAIRARLRLAALFDGAQGEVGDKLALATDFNHGGLDIFRFNLNLIQHACELMGADLFVAKQATLIVPGLSEKDRERCRYDYHGFDHDAHVAAYQAMYDIIDEELPGDRVLDMTSLSGKSEVFADHVHPTEAGARRIATLMADKLALHVQVKRP